MVTLEIALIGRPAVNLAVVELRHPAFNAQIVADRRRIDCGVARNAGEVDIGGRRRIPSDRLFVVDNWGGGAAGAELTLALLATAVLSTVSLPLSAPLSLVVPVTLTVEDSMSP